MRSSKTRSARPTTRCDWPICLTVWQHEQATGLQSKTRHTHSSLPQAGPTTGRLMESLHRQSPAAGVEHPPVTSQERTTLDPTNNMPVAQLRCVMIMSQTMKQLRPLHPWLVACTLPSSSEHTSSWQFQQWPLDPQRWKRIA